MFDVIDLAKARALCAAATPGPWTFTTCYGVATVQHGPGRDAIAHAVDYLQVGDEYDNASFIASARTLLPEALDALEQERAVCVTITTALKQAIVERDPLKAEVERLTQSDRNVILALKAENARLRKALEQIADTPHIEGGSGEQMAKMASKAISPAAGGEDV
jgi:hypothetical protein